ncbi:MAG: hypothetical protein LBN39_13115 [Planctomycetaceae bacterium]|jgi:hypothetical protein|nr:hypothetical protein [Planctomycetaceae bacterium]
MKNLRNIIMFTALGVFFAWYGLSWAYSSLYKEPRQRLGSELTKLKAEIETGKKNTASMQHFTQQNLIFYYRSLPLIPDQARTQYSFWLLEVFKYCGIEKPDIESTNPTRTAFGLNYRVNVRASCSLDQLSRFLFEFYYAPFLHRITVLSIAPVEGKEGEVTLSATLDVLALRPMSAQAAVPSKDKLPTGYIPRLKLNDLTNYRVIADRNLMQAARGGIDKADYAYLTSIITTQSGQPEIWITVRTESADHSVVKARKGETVRIGSFIAAVVDIAEQDVVFEKDGMRWLVSIGDCLNNAYAVPPELF